MLVALVCHQKACIVPKSLNSSFFANTCGDSIFICEADISLYVKYTKKEPTQTQQVEKEKIKLDLIFCTSDITKYQYSEYSDVYLKNAFGGGCPSSKPIKISYKQISELKSSNYKLCYNKKITEGLRVNYTPSSCNKIYGGGGVQIKYDGKQFYYMGIRDGTQIAEKTTQTDDSSNVVQQLKDLNELYESGVLTEEEFSKAKKKLLN